MAIMVLLSRKFFKGLLDKGGAGFQLDFYRVYGLLFLLAMNMDVLMGDQYISLWKSSWHF
ncbi:hypothetical protein Q5O89_09960 [Peribacillus frigoritolerans]|nr:hypothetical protein [Peribacillus frigoritolerans]